LPTQKQGLDWCSGRSLVTGDFHMQDTYEMDYELDLSPEGAD